MGFGEKSVIVTAPTNIAIVKYWGKRCQKLNLPLNSSLSATLSQNHLKSTTKIQTSPSFAEDEVWLNGVKQDVQGNKRLLACLSEIRKLLQTQSAVLDKSLTAKELHYNQRVHVHSENDFPTGAGLASSASGYAALVFGLGALFEIEGDLTTIARQGSGSACRSLHGGFVEWKKGKREDGKDSVGVQLATENHWPELRIFVLVVKDTRKKIGSTEGMQSTVRTSNLLKHRVENVVENNMLVVKQAIMKKDFSMLGEVTMKESNQLHAVCLDTYPPLHYLNEVSYMIMDFVHEYNKAAGSVRAAYTFDAGPNACIFTSDKYASELAWLISNYFPSSNEQFLRGLDIEIKRPSDEFLGKIRFDENKVDLVKYVICTTLGSGPLVLSNG